MITQSWAVAWGLTAAFVLCSQVYTCTQLYVQHCFKNLIALFDEANDKLRRVRRQQENLNRRRSLPTISGQRAARHTSLHGNAQVQRTFTLPVAQPWAQAHARLNIAMGAATGSNKGSLNELLRWVQPVYSTSLFIRMLDPMGFYFLHEAFKDFLSYLTTSCGILMYLLWLKHVTASVLKVNFRRAISATERRVFDGLAAATFFVGFLSVGLRLFTENNFWLFGMYAAWIALLLFACTILYIKLVRYMVANINNVQASGIHEEGGTSVQSTSAQCISTSVQSTSARTPIMDPPSPVEKSKGTQENSPTASPVPSAADLSTQITQPPSPADTDPPSPMSTPSSGRPSLGHSIHQSQSTPSLPSSGLGQDMPTPQGSPQRDTLPLQQRLKPVLTASPLAQTHSTPSSTSFLSVPVAQSSAQLTPPAPQSSSASLVSASSTRKRRGTMSKAKHRLLLLSMCVQIMVFACVPLLTIDALASWGEKEDNYSEDDEFEARPFVFIWLQCFLLCVTSWYTYLPYGLWWSSELSGARQAARGA